MVLRCVRFTIVFLSVGLTLMACSDTKTPIERPVGESRGDDQLNAGLGEQGLSSLIVSEVVARSDDESFLDANDWIELYNGGQVAVDLRQYSLSDSASERFALPAQVLEAGQYIVIAAVDSEAANSSYPFVPFKLGSEDSVILFKQGALVSSLSWVAGEADRGQSFGLLDGLPQSMMPTPNASNQPMEILAPSGDSELRLSEVVAKSDRDDFLQGNDWVELVNTGNVSIDLSDYFLADSLSEHFRLPAVSLEPGEYFVIAAVDSEDVSPPSPSVPFKLGAADAVYLYLGDELVDTLLWVEGDADEGKGFGWVDGVSLTTLPTPMLVNQAELIFVPSPVSSSTLRVNEIVAKSDTEFLDGSDWIELYNSGADSLYLGDFTIADSGSAKVGLPAQWLDAGEYLVLAAVDADLVGPPALSVPFKLGGSDSVLLYLNDELVQVLLWSSGEAEAGSSFGLLGGGEQTLVPTPMADNRE